MAARRSARASFSGFEAFKSTSVGGIDTPSSNSSLAVRRTAANESTAPARARKDGSVARKRLRHVSTCRAAKRAPRRRAKRCRNVFAPISVSESLRLRDSFCSRATLVSSSSLVSWKRNIDPNRSFSAKKSPSSAKSVANPSAATPRVKKNPLRNKRRVSSRRFFPLLVFGAAPARTIATSRRRNRKPCVTHTTSRTSSSSLA